MIVVLRNYNNLVSIVGVFLFYSRRFNTQAVLQTVHGLRNHPRFRGARLWMLLSRHLAQRQRCIHQLVDFSRTYAAKRTCACSGGTRKAGHHHHLFEYLSG